MHHVYNGLLVTEDLDKFVKNTNVLRQSLLDDEENTT